MEKSEENTVEVDIFSFAQFHSTMEINITICTHTAAILLHSIDRTQYALNVGRSPKPVVTAGGIKRSKTVNGLFSKKPLSRIV